MSVQEEGKAENTMSKLLRDIAVGVVIGIVIDATIQALHLEVLFPVLPYIWFGIVTFLTIDGLKRKKIQDTLATYYGRLSQRDKMISYIAVGIIGIVVAEGYWFGIKKVFELRAAQSTKSIATTPPTQSPNTHLSIQLLPSVNEERDITTDVTGAMIIVLNDGADTQLNFDRLVKFPPIKDAVPDGSGRIQIISGNKRGSTFIHIAAPSLVVGERHSITVTFLKSQPYLSSQRWKFDYGYSEDIFVQRAFVGPEQTLATPSNTPTPQKPPAAKEKVPSEGLEFHEVPRAELGYPKQTVPDAFTIQMGGGMATTIPTEQLKNQVPFSKMSGIKLSGEVPLKIYFDNQQNLRVDATIYQRKDEVAAVIKGSNFAVLNVAWDRNWDATAFEIVDERKIPIFQIERPQWNLLRIRGLFISSDGSIFVVNENELAINPIQPVQPPSRLFEYPSKSHLHQRLAH
jgi:hypothetical protein